MIFALPLYDDNPTSRDPVVTYLLIGLCVGAFLWQLGQQNESAVLYSYGMIPARLFGLWHPGNYQGVASWTTLVTSMFLHGGWFHLIGNMWFLWVFGDNIEDSMGRVRFVIFYLVCGIAAALSQVALNPASGIPMVGASGAISGVMGAYLILYPRVRVFCLLILGFFITSIALPAWTMLLYWAAIQFFSGLVGLAAQESGGVAFAAHVGGFLAGIVLIKLFARPDDVMAHQREQWQPRRLVRR